MFKKLFIISVAIFVLTGCGKEVTEDMLIGKWNCDNTVYTFNGIEQNLMPSEDVEIIKNGGDLSIQTILNKDIFILGSTNKNDWQQSNDNEYQNSYEYIFGSNDEFKVIIKQIVRKLESKENLAKSHAEIVCKRIID